MRLKFVLFAIFVLLSMMAISRAQEDNLRNAINIAVNAYYPRNVFAFADSSIDCLLIQNLDGNSIGQLTDYREDDKNDKAADMKITDGTMFHNGTDFSVVVAVYNHNILLHHETF